MATSSKRDRLAKPTTSIILAEEGQKEELEGAKGAVVVDYAGAWGWVPTKGVKVISGIRIWVLAKGLEVTLDI